MGETQPLSLFELNNNLKDGIKGLFPASYWVVAEISELNINQSGHCYLELIEKNPENEKIIAKAKATVWAFTFRMLRPYFESVTRQKLGVGLKIMVQVSIEFHELFGYSLNIKDIEPTYTVGDLSRKKEEIIERLIAEGVFHLNKELPLPIVPQRIAVISSETAAGYGDFIDQLKNNNQGYAFHITLFQAFMQGEEAGESIIRALEQIFGNSDTFDLVVIIRGGGSQSDLDCFNSYWLCYHITQFPLPVITGIGHERDETITDLVAHTNLKTPTAVAEFILDRVSSFDAYLMELNDQVMSIAEEQVAAWKLRTEKLSRNIVALVNLRMNGEIRRLTSLGVIGSRMFKSYIHDNQLQLNSIKSGLRSGLVHYFNHNAEMLAGMKKNMLMLARNTIKKEKMRLDHFQMERDLIDPLVVMKRGYTLTYSKGYLVKSVTQLKPGDTIESIWIDGKSSSMVNSVNKSSDTQ